MNVGFLFPGSDKYEALDNWVRTIARYCTHTVSLAREPADCFDSDFVFVLTEGRTYATPDIDQDLADLRQMSRSDVHYAVVHNNDNPGVPTPGAYPSFCWTEQAKKRLAAYSPTLVRQPVLPPLIMSTPWTNPDGRPLTRGGDSMPLHIGTFGHIERKKSTYEMAKWAKANGLPFTAFCPEALAGQYSVYIDSVKRAGANVVLYPWADRVEDLAPLFADVSHFLFVLPRSKGSSGGSPTSPRFATAFARPVIVVDDELLLSKDGVYVFDSLDDIQGLEQMRLPVTDWGPEQYIAELVKLTLAWRAA
jgi:hypothetical protein